MMRPYVTVVKDSFHEAFASRVLWILLGAATLLLLAIVPIGLKEEQASRMQLGSVADWPGLIARIKRALLAEAPSPGKRIWELADDDLRQVMDEAMRKEGPPEVSRENASRLIDGFNRLLDRRDLYDEAAWAEVTPDRPTKKLLAAGIAKLSAAEGTLLNRRLLKAAFPAEIAAMPDKELRLSYLGWNVGSPLPISRKMAEPAIRQLAARAMDFFVGSIAVFVAVLVTAPMIPRTFEPGAVDLLLSKPIARPLLFLAKFFGGCAFILWVAGYVAVGVWVILGVRFGLWIPSLLACIPVFLFLFSIYYSVSACVGVIWKNATVAIVLTMLFWAACFTVGAAKGIVEQFFIHPTRIVDLVPTGDSLLAVTQGGDFLQWRNGAWETVLPAERGRGPRPAGDRRMIGPVYSAAADRLAYVSLASPNRFGFLQGGVRLNLAKWAGGAWKRSNGPTPPADAAWLFLDPRGRLIVVASSGIYALNEAAAEGGGGTTVLGITLPFGGGNAFSPVGPKEPLELREGFAAAMDPASGDLAVLDSGRLVHLRRQGDGRYLLKTDDHLEEAGGRALLAFAGKSIVAALADGRVLVLDAETRQIRKELRPAGNDSPRAVMASANGSAFAVLFHGGRLAVLDAKGGLLRVMGGDVSAAAFAGNQEIVVADRETRVSRYDLGDFQLVDRQQPGMDLLQGTYRYFILPFYRVFPKPGELGNVISYLLASQDAAALGPAAVDPRQPQRTVDVYGPLASSLAFVLVMLAITCLIVHRADIA